VGDSLASEIYVPTFRITLPVPSLVSEDGTDRMFIEIGTGCSETKARNIQTPGNHSKERIKLKTRRNF
jgi:hypothetical protein